MDKRTVEQPLHDRILERAGEAEKRPVPFAAAGRLTVVKRVTAVAACGALVGGVLLTMPLWLPRLPKEPVPAVSITAVATTGGETAAAPPTASVPGTTAASSAAAKPTAAKPTAAQPTAAPNGALVFNESSALGKSMYIPGYFTEPLSAARQEALLGDTLALLKEFPSLTASAGFTGTGRLYQVGFSAGTADEWDVQIRLAGSPGGLFSCYAYGGEKRISVVRGVEVTAGVVSFSKAPGDGRCHASFALGSTAYLVEVNSDTAAAKARLTALVDSLTAGRPADLSQVTYTEIPPWREDDLTLAQARTEAEFGPYVPHSVPKGFAFESARRSLGQNHDYLRLCFTRGTYTISWQISRKTGWDDRRLVDVNRPVTYDLSLYPIPRADSVPDELYYPVNYPIFRAEQFTLDAVKKRVWTINDSPKRMDFAVLYGDILVEVTTEAVEPDLLFAMLEKLK